jgi:hypothetical protein
MEAIHSRAFMGVSFPNIGISCRTGEYIGYSAGNDGIWFIKRANPIGSKHRWLVQKKNNKDCFYARTLGEISEKLSSLDDAATVTNC